MKVFLLEYYRGGPGTSQKYRIASLKEDISVGPSVFPQKSLTLIRERGRGGHGILVVELSQFDQLIAQEFDDG